MSGNRFNIIKHYLGLINYLVFKNRYPGEWGSTNQSAHGIRLNEAKRVIFMCDGSKGHGGLSDRIQGILTTYYEAKRQHLPFFINWTSPFDLQEFLVPSGECDWRIAPQELSYDYRNSFPVIMDLSPSHVKNTVKKLIFKYSFRGKRDILVYTNMMYVQKHRRELYRELFKPSAYLQQHINLHLNAIGTNYWSYTFRFGNCLGDFRDIVGFPLDEEAKIRLADKNIDELKRLLKDLPKGFKALVTSDSLFFLNRVETVDDRIYIVKKELKHIDFCRTEECDKEVWLKSFLDQHLIMNARKVFLLKTGEMYKSGFPMLAAVLGDRQFVYHEF